MIQTVLTALAILFTAAGICILFDIRPVRSDREITFSFTTETAEKKRKSINNRKELSWYQKYQIQINALLKKAKKDRKYFYTVSGLCFVGGNIVGYICFSGAMLAIVSGIAFIPLAYLYLVIRTQEATRAEIAELEYAMSMITNSYVINNDILRSVEIYIAEKNRYMDDNIRSAGPFEEFVAGCLMISSNIDRELELLASRIRNKHFDQWIRNLRLCQENKDMKFSLQPVIDAMSDEKIMQMESDTIMRQTWGTYLSTVAVTFAVILAFRIANRDWYLILVDTVIGKALIVTMIIAALVSSIYVSRLNKPINTI